MYLIQEIFLSLQGEGRRTGEVSCFIRFAGCPLEHSCPIKCDTEFNSGRRMTAEQISSAVAKLIGPRGWIIFTGGEPAVQLDDELVEALAAYRIAIETSGAFALQITGGMDFLTISPKCSDAVLARNFKRATELRYVIRHGQPIPVPAIAAEYLFISPEWDGPNTQANIAWCVDLVLKNPEWRLSLQTHKLIGIR
jgi:7-carboxy-7-deazaguanine synthase